MLLGNRSKHNSSEGMPTAVSGIGDDPRLTQEEFADLLGRIDDGLRALPATGQVGSASLLLLLTMRFGSTAKVLAKCMLKYYRLSECI